MNEFIRNCYAIDGLRSVSRSQNTPKTDLKSDCITWISLLFDLSSRTSWEKVCWLVLLQWHRFRRTAFPFLYGFFLTRKNKYRPIDASVKAWKNMKKKAKSWTVYGTNKKKYRDSKSILKLHDIILSSGSKISPCSWTRMFFYSFCYSYFLHPVTMFGVFLKLPTGGTQIRRLMNNISS